MKKENRNKLLLMLAVLILVMLSCSEVYVINETEMNVRVIVRMPGESVPETVMLKPKDTEAFFSDFGGSYNVSVIPDEEYRAQLLSKADAMRMLLVTNFGDLKKEKITALLIEIEKLDKLLENREMISCSGTVDDTNSASDPSVDVSITQNYATQKLSVICP